ncbi:MAG TPA: protein kinase, partial [Gemmataceae bacterium]|nr:protein kinase [Gemmataceae bacterium]
MNDTEPVSESRTPTEMVGTGTAPPGWPAGRAARFGRRFRGTRVLKQGNGVVTLLGTDIANDRPVIIKSAVAGAFSASTQMRLEHEAEVLRSLRSPYLGSLLAVGREQGELYLVLPLIPGTTLQQSLKDGLLDVTQTLTVARCLLAALQEAHD